MLPSRARPRPHAAVRTASAVAAVTVLPAVLAGCSLGGGEEETPGSQRVVVATHGSWNMDKAVLRAFTEETGYRVEVKPAGDAGELTNKLVLTKNSPIADLVYGIDNTFVSRAAEEGVLTPYEPQDAVGAELEPEDAEVAELVTPIDFSDVCVNVDDTWFAKEGLEPPSTYDDLVDPRYEGLFVTPAPSTSSPGLAFLVGTVARYGDDGWEDYWQRLLDNGTKLTAGWEDAYLVDFSAGGGGGDRPIVLSYASSPPFTVPEGEDEPTTSALLDTCTRQVEYAAVLEGAENPEGAQAFIDFMTTQRFQEALPETMYVYPADTSVDLPPDWAAHAPTAERTWDLPESTVAENRDAWLQSWADLAQR